MSETMSELIERTPSLSYCETNVIYLDQFGDLVLCNNNKKMK